MWLLRLIGMGSFVRALAGVSDTLLHWVSDTLRDRDRMTSEGTPRRTIRITDAIWNRAEERATTQGRRVVDVIREYLIEYGKEGSAEK